jgi:hypothetical protein
MVMDATLIAVIVSLLADVVAKIVAGRKSDAQVKEMGKAVEGLKVLQEQQIQMSSAINRRVEVLEHRVAYLENYRPQTELTDQPERGGIRTDDQYLDSHWPPHKKGRRH